jgi:hypothetical protein
MGAFMAAITGSEGGCYCSRLKRGLWGEGRPLRLRDMGGSKRGGAHGAVAREKGEAALGRREEEEGQVSCGPEGLVGWLATWAGRGWMAWDGRQAKAGGVGRPAGPSGLNSEEEFFSNKN